ncbi:MAG: phospholipase [Acetobacteraceae bacterium]|nr:phospholipase [Acetobacteraceae bacterium]
MDIRHVVVLMLENRSFDCMLGMLYPNSEDFDGLIGTESNIWHKPDGSQLPIQVWKDPTLTAETLVVPDPDPGELFTDIQMQMLGLTDDGQLNTGLPSMGGFVDNYMRQPPSTTAPDPYAVMHYFTPDQLPVISQLARAFGVSDRWHASAPCQTWPNRFFAHTGTANGYINNSPTHFPYTMETVFNRLSDVGQSWRVYYHDIPQSVTLARLWSDVLTHFRHFEEDFAGDAAAGKLPSYSFIEPRYFPDRLGNKAPNDEHPPHNIAYGEALTAAVYNAVRSGPGWKNTLLVITCDEHGGCYDHVVPPPATPPGGQTPDGFNFDVFGVRVPAVIVSPYVQAGSIIRPTGPTPFDHTSIIATLRKLFGFAPLTARDQAAPDLLEYLDPNPNNDGPPSITAPAVPPAPAQVARDAAKPPNDLQKSLSTAAVVLPTAGADIGAHINRLSSVPDSAPSHATAGDAAADVTAHMRAFTNSP